jgi:hypothetical protein
MCAAAALLADALADVRTKDRRLADLEGELRHSLASTNGAPSSSWLAAQQTSSTYSTYGCYAGLACCRRAPLCAPRSPRALITDNWLSSCAPWRVGGGPTVVGDNLWEKCKQQMEEQLVRAPHLQRSACCLAPCV